MFTGLIKEIGSVVEIKRTGDVHALVINAGDIVKDASVGDSIAVNGVCLTVVKAGKDSVAFEIMDESIKKSNLASLTKSSPVNLEPSLKIGDKLGGHFVTGHIDTVGTIKKILKSRDTSEIQISFPAEFRKYLAPKGSVAIDGISLTLGEVKESYFSVHIIPHTLKSTRLAVLKAGEAVNIEFDLMAKYAQNPLNKPKGITHGFLAEHGFM